MAKQQGESVPRRAYSYLRYSGQGQSRGTTIKRQTEYAPALCERKGWFLDTTRQLHDKATSAFRGRNALVGFLGQFKRDVAEGLVAPGSILIVENLDRLSRQDVDTAFQAIRELIVAGITICTREPEREYAPGCLSDMRDRQEIEFIIQRAHEESKTKSFRSGSGWGFRKQQARESGRVMTRKGPAWLQVKDGKWVKDDARCATIAQIFDWCIDGLSVYAIGCALRADPKRYPTIGWKGGWSDTYLKSILSGKAVLGILQSSKTMDDGTQEPDGEPVPGYYPAVVSEERWLIAQSCLRHRQTAHGRKPKYGENLFRGLLRFPELGLHGAISTKSSCGKVYRYVAAIRAGHVKANATGGGAVPYDDFEDAILNYLKELDPLVVQGHPDGNRATVTQIAKLMETQVSQDAKLRMLRADLLETEQTEAEMLETQAMIRELVRRKEAGTALMNRLKLEVSSGRNEACAVIRGLVDAKRAAQGSKRDEICRRIAARIPDLVRRFDLIIRAASKAARVVYVRIQTRWGEPEYLVIRSGRFASDPPEENPPDLFSRFPLDS